MSGHVSRLSVILQQLYPNAKYFTHCHNYALNLVIFASCHSVPNVQNFMETLKELTLFFKYSAKRKHIFSEHLKSSQEYFLADCVDSDLVSKRRYHGLPVLSDTCWLTRVDSIHCLLRNYRAVCEAIEEVRDSSSGQVPVMQTPSSNTTCHLSYWRLLLSVNMSFRTQGLSLLFFRLRVVTCTKPTEWLNDY